MRWSLKRMFGRRKLDADIAHRDAKILRLTAAGDRLNQELNQVRRELAEERGKTQAAMVQYAQVCTERDIERQQRITAQADVKELTGQREDQAQQIEELRRELAEAKGSEK